MIKNLSPAGGILAAGAKKSRVDLEMDLKRYLHLPPLGRSDHAKSHRPIYWRLKRKDSIRYLVLEPGKGDDPTVCSLRESRLKDMRKVVAISYVWGSRERNSEIRCNGQCFKITENLHTALRMARQPAERCLVWADAICINQDDVQERGHQVSVMGRIYGTAKQVLICLGPDPEGHAKAAGSLVAQMDKFILRVAKDCNYASNSFPWPDTNDEILSDLRWADFGVMVVQPWFRRGWVVQEAGLAAEAVLLWGATAISWPSIVRVSAWASGRGVLKNIQNCSIPNPHLLLHRRHSKRIVECVTNFRNRYSYDSLDLLQSASLLKFEDGRDFLYALLPLAEEEFTLEPDYNRSIQDVYLDFTRDCLLPAYGAEILAYVQHDEGSIETDISWVPRWDRYWYHPIIDRRSPFLISQSSNDFKGISLFDAGTLRVRAIIFDSISFTSASFDFQTSLSETVNLWQVISASDRSEYYPLQRRMSAFLTVLTDGMYPRELRTWKRQEAAYARQFENHQSPREMANNFSPIQEMQEEVRGKVMDFHSYSVRRMINKVFISTQRGLYGNAPYIAREGDWCCIIFGMQSPAILRPTAKPNHYKLVGSTWMASKAIVERKDEDGALHPVSRLLGRKGAEVWVEWGLEEEDIYLV